MGFSPLMSSAKIYDIVGRHLQWDYRRGRSWLYVIWIDRQVWWWTCIDSLNESLTWLLFFRETTTLKFVSSYWDTDSTLTFISQLSLWSWRMRSLELSSHYRGLNKREIRLTCGVYEPKKMQCSVWSLHRHFAHVCCCSFPSDLHRPLMCRLRLQLWRSLDHHGDYANTSSAECWRSSRSASN